MDFAYVCIYYVYRCANYYSLKVYSFPLTQFNMMYIGNIAFI